jgi:F-type H+-transporting ATPase subunit alpha
MLNLNNLNRLEDIDLPFLTPVVGEDEVSTDLDLDFFALLMGSNGPVGASDLDEDFFMDNNDTSAMNNIGVVDSFKDSVVTISGLWGVQANELIYFESGVAGVALNLEYNIVKALVFGGSGSVRTSEVVRRSKLVMQVGVGSQVLGRIINPLGSAIDGLGEIAFEEFRPIEKKAPGVITRKKINEPVETGLKIVDSLVPIGRGQRELILGDRKTGKTTIAIDTILNQLETKRKFRAVMSCVYVAVGKRMSEIVRISRLLQSRGVARTTALVVARASDPASLQFIAPYSACTMAEYFTYKGHHALIIYDDLTRHADAYRQISLLLRRPVGREAYPGDIFYLHSRLLERAVKLSLAFGGGSLTALPIVETIQGDVSAYIPTNVISITDGQIYLDLIRHQEGNRPAVDPGISVSRVGSSAQSKMMKRLAGSLKLELAQYREVEQFSKFGSELDAGTRALLFRGTLMIATLRQGRNRPMSMFNQLLVFYLTSTDFFLNTVATDPSVKPLVYFRSLYFFLEVSVFMVPSRIALEKQNIVPRELLDDLVKIHFAYYLNENRADLLNNPTEELRAISAKYGTAVAEVLRMAGPILNFLES